MTIIGQFRDLDDADAFVWLRGFADMRTRAASLEAFYGGPVWRAHRNAANATMVSSDDVRLLRPSRPAGAFSLGPRSVPAASPVTATPGVVLLTIYTLRPDAVAHFDAFFAREVQPRLEATGARPLALLETEPAPNNFPRLPVREGESVVVWFARFDGPAALQHHLSAFEADTRWIREVGPALGRRLLAPTIHWRLTPTSRSRRFEDGSRDGGAY